LCKSFASSVAGDALNIRKFMIGYRSLATIIAFATIAPANALADSADTADAVTAVDGDIIVTGNLTQRIVAGGVQEVLPQSRSTLVKAQLEKLVGLDSAVSGALKYVPGVHFGGGDGSGITEGKFTIRGFNGDQIGFSRDGVPLNDPQFLTPHVDFFGDPENYATVSVLYGSSSINSPSFTASGGSVEITTVAPTDEAGLLIKQGFGSYDLRRTFARANIGKIGGFSAWISASQTNGDLWTQGGGQLKSRRFEANLQYEWEDGSRINLVASDFKMRTNSYFNPTLAQYRSLPYDAGYPQLAYPTAGGTSGTADVLLVDGSSAALNRADFAIQTYGVNSLFNLGDKVRLRVDPYYVRVVHGAASVGATALPEALLGVDTSGDGDLLDTRPLGIGVYPTQHRLGGTARLDIELADTNTLQIGGWYDHVRGVNELLLQPINADGSPASKDGSIRIRDANGTPIDLTDQRNRIITQKVWLQDSWDFLTDWNATLGLAYQHTKLAGTNVAGILSGVAYSRSASYDRLLPSFSLSWSATENHQFYYNTTSNIRVPAVVSVYVLNPTSKQKAETTWNQELGWRYTTPNVIINAALFYDRFKNRQVSYQVVTGVTSYFNAGDVTTKGGEISINGKLPYNFTYGGSFSHVIAKQKSNYTVGGLSAPTKGNQLFDTPENLASASVGYDDSRFYLNILGRYTSSFYGDLANSEKINHYTIFDLNAGIRLNDLFGVVRNATLSANLNNVFDKKYLAGVNAGSVNASPGGNFYAAPTYLRGAPRSLFVNLAVEF